MRVRRVARCLRDMDSDQHQAMLDAVRRLKGVLSQDGRSLSVRPKTS
jgi:hypothetical protein